MTLKKISPFAAAALLSLAFVACSNDNTVSSDSGIDVLGESELQESKDVQDVQGEPEGLPAEQSAVENSKSKSRGSDAGTGEIATEEVGESAGSDSVDVSSEGVAVDEPEAPVDNYATCMESSACVDSVFNILFPDGIDGVDTARHEPDSVGVWHFYDPRGTHDNPDFAYGEMTDPRDGIVYKTTTIGGVVWMAENLNYFDIEGAPSSIKNDWCYWDKPENCESAGRLYTWKVAKRVCPEGWHLPTNDDWTALLTAVGADTLNPIAWRGANVLKSKSGWENSGSGTDDFGFTALPAGRKFFTKVQDGFTNHGCSAYMWSATEPDISAGADTLAFSLELNCSNENAIVNTTKKADGLSVRCVKDE